MNLGFLVGHARGGVIGLDFRMGFDYSSVLKREIVLAEQSHCG